ncbi:MAG: hypothetical protein LBM04_08995 [Opitutaceae bacterium]|jgi:hypothetical protein|nr:hypothetical protein [Opitutaceae bacterium]
MQPLGNVNFGKLHIILLAFAGVFCHAARATLYSTNTGSVPNTGIHYTVTLEDDVTSRMAIRFRLTNKSGKTYYIHRSAFDVPGNLAVFFSTDDTPVITSTDEWVSDMQFSGAVIGTLQLRPGKTLDEIFPIGFYYNKIYKRRQQSAIYVYWGVTMKSSSDDIEHAQLENRDVVTPITEKTFPRIGGMLTLPRKIAD